MFIRALKDKISGNSLRGQICAEIIKDELKREKPSMIARFGSVEIKAVLYPHLPRLLKVLLKKRIFHSMEINAGFFPVNEESIKRFSDLIYNDIKQLDIIGSWRIEEYFFRKEMHNVLKIELSGIEPYFQKYPWTVKLKDKNVLVIHPFSETIESQYLNNRENLFKNSNLLPEFKSLQTIKAVQTIAGNRSGFEDWFQALEYMKEEINKLEFDIAIIGCGAYGFPLAAHVKRMGKKALHMGGATQILFGIKGKRWSNIKKFDTVINEYFVSPNETDRPKNSDLVENGCYW